MSNKILSIFCIDAVSIRAIGKLPFRTHCNFLHGINDTFPIDVMLERICIVKFI